MVPFLIFFVILGLSVGLLSEQLIDRVRKLSPRFASLRYPQPLDVGGTREVLDRGTVMLSFSVCQDRTVLFVVRPAGTELGLSVFTVPVGEQTLRSQVEQFRNLIIERRAATDGVLVARARELYDELLRPAESLLATSERLLLVPDGPLHLLPFQALMRNANEYLVEWKPLTTVASGTVYAELKKAHGKESKSIELVAFGDPHYPEPAKEQSKPIADKEQSKPIADLEVKAALQRGLTLGRLPFSRMEVENVSALYPYHSQKYLGTQATEERAKSLGKDVRYIHFAVHTLLDEQFPLNSALVLTIPDRAPK
jgi:CHAT domain-containing protein